MALPACSGGCWTCSRPSFAARSAGTRAFINGAVFVVFVSISDRSCDRNTAQTKLIATNVYRDAFLRTSRPKQDNTTVGDGDVQRFGWHSASPGYHFVAHCDEI